MKTETGRNFDIDLKNAHTLAGFVNSASPECSPIDALHKCIDRLAEYARPEVGNPTSPQEPAFWIVRGRRGKRTWLLHPADSEVNARAVANGLKDATITPMYTTPQPVAGNSAAPTLPADASRNAALSEAAQMVDDLAIFAKKEGFYSGFISMIGHCAGQIRARKSQPVTTKPAKTGRDLYRAHAISAFPKCLPEWCELHITEQMDWNAKAGEGWIDWAGGACPVDVGAVVDISLRDGDMLTNRTVVGDSWHHKFGGGDIIAYRISKDQS